MKKPLIHLYSSSPRRLELMKKLDIPFDMIPSDADESIPGDTSPQESVIQIAARKLEVGLRGNPKHFVSWGIAADTLVEGSGRLLGKPSNAEEAAMMLSELSGRTHNVHTGLVVYAPFPSNEKSLLPKDADKRPKESLDSILSNGFGTLRSLCHTTEVTFRALLKDEIQSYIHSGEWQGAAGAYRIQDKGAVLIDRINGLWSTVVGLPLGPLYGILAELSYPLG